MLSGKGEKRIASSLFIHLAPPRRDHLARGKIEPLEATHLPCHSKEALKTSGPAPPQIRADAAQGSRGYSPRAAGMPNRGYSALPPCPTGSGWDSGQAGLPSTLPLLHPTSFSVETLGPDLEKQTAVLPTSLQAPSAFPADPRQPNALPLVRAGEQQTGRRMESAASPDVCAFCHKGLSLRAPAIEAMNKQYHADCFTCRMCTAALAGQHYYQKEGRPLCVACFKSTLEKCARCQALILSQIVRAMGSGYHPECFTCVVCGRTIGDETFAVDEEDKVHCLRDFYRKYASVCSACEKPIIPGEGRDAYKIECMGQSFHESCYRCENCQVMLSPEPTEDGCYPLGSRLLCKSCNIQQREQLSC